MNAAEVEQIITESTPKTQKNNDTFETKSFSSTKIEHI